MEVLEASTAAYAKEQLVPSSSGDQGMNTSQEVPVPGSLEGVPPACDSKAQSSKVVPTFSSSSSATSLLSSPSAHPQDGPEDPDPLNPNPWQEVSCTKALLQSLSGSLQLPTVPLSADEEKHHQSITATLAKFCGVHTYFLADDKLKPTFMNCLMCCADYVFPDEDSNDSTFWTSFAKKGGVPPSDFATWFPEALFGAAHMAHYAIFSWAPSTDGESWTWKELVSSFNEHGFDYMHCPDALTDCHILQVKFYDQPTPCCYQNVLYSAADAVSGIADACFLAYDFFEWTPEFEQPFSSVSELVSVLAQRFTSPVKTSAQTQYEIIGPVSKHVDTFRTARDLALYGTCKDAEKHKQKTLSEKDHTPADHHADMETVAAKLAKVAATADFQPAQYQQAAPLHQPAVPAHQATPQPAFQATPQQAFLLFHDPYAPAHMQVPYMPQYPGYMQPAPPGYYGYNAPYAPSHIAYQAPYYNNVANSHNVMHAAPAPATLALPTVAHTTQGVLNYVLSLPEDQQTAASAFLSGQCSDLPMAIHRPLGLAFRALSPTKQDDLRFALWDVYTAPAPAVAPTPAVPVAALASPAADLASLTAATQTAA
jgi:hypothetical protein